MSIVCEKIFAKLSSGQIWTGAYWRMPVFIHSFMFLEEWKFKTQTYTTYSVLWLQAPAWVGSYRGKIIVIAKVSL